MRTVPRTNPIPTREIDIARRFKEARLEARATRSYVAARLGTDSQAISRIELGRSVLRADVASKFCAEFKVSQRWLATGVGRDDRYVHLPDGLPAPEAGFEPDGTFSQMYDRVLAPHCEAFYRIDGASILRQLGRVSYQRPVGQRGAGAPSHEAPILIRAVSDLVNYLTAVVPPSLYAWLFDTFRKTAEEFVQSAGPRIEHDNQAIGRDTAAAARGIASMGIIPALESSLPAHSENNLTTKSDYVKVTPMPTWAQLKADVQKFTDERGAKADLARHCNVTPQAVATWLDDERETEPGAEATLKLLDWVKDQKAKQNKGAASPSPAPAPKTKPQKTGKKKR